MARRLSGRVAIAADLIGCCGNFGPAWPLTGMKMAKAIRQQAATAERVALNTADAVVAGQMKALAQAFRVQAEIIKKEKKKKKK